MAAPARSGASGKIVLVGCSGLVGRATIDALNRSGRCGCTIVTRDPARFTSGGRSCEGCDVVRGDLNDEESLKPHFMGASAVFIITPGAENRAELVRHGLNAAKASRVPFVQVVSVMTADNARTTLGRQFSEIERATKECGIPYTLLRCALFTDNLMMQAENIRTGKLFGTSDPDTPFTTVCSKDVGEAAAAILCNPGSHSNKTYHIVGPSTHRSEQVAWLTSALGKRVEYEQKSLEFAEKFFTDKGMQTWQAKAMTELFAMINDGRYNYVSEEDRAIKKLTGRDPWSAQQWIDNSRSELLGERGGAGGAGGKGEMGISGIGLSGKAAGMGPGMEASGTMGGAAGLSGAPGTRGPVAGIDTRGGTRAPGHS